MFWNVEDRGFLPSCDPLAQIPISNYKNTQLIFTLENLAHMMPCFLSERRWREELLYELRQVTSAFGPNVIDRLSSEGEIERALLLFNIFASSYLYAIHEVTLQALPKEISLPLNKAAKQCGRRPGLSYTSYVLYNWQNNGGIEPLVTFTDKDTEKKLIAAFVNQSFDLAEFINSRKETPITYMLTWKSTLEKAINRLRTLRKEIDVQELEVLSEYYKDHPENECNPFAQAPIFSMLYRLFSAADKDPLLQKAESDISGYRPGRYGQFVTSLNPLATLVVDRVTLDAYNDCLQLAIDLHHEMFMVRSQDDWVAPRVQALKKCFRQGV